MTREKLLEAMISGGMSYLCKMERPMPLVSTHVHKSYVVTPLDDQYLGNIRCFYYYTVCGVFVIILEGFLKTFLKQWFSARGLLCPPVI